MKNNDHEAVKKDVKDILTRVQMMYCPPMDISGKGNIKGDGSLGTTIKITPVSDPVHYPNKKLTANCEFPPPAPCTKSDLDIMEDTTREEFEKDRDGLALMVYLAHDEASIGGRGLAQPSIVCESNPNFRAIASSVSEYNGLQVTAQVSFALILHKITFFLNYPF